MNRQLFVAPWMLVALLAIGCQKPAGNPGEAAAIAAIQKLGGRVEVDEQQPEKPVIKVYLHSTPVQDADLAHLEHLKSLQNLFLGKTGITDAGLEHLRGASHLKTLSLNVTGVTDAGLKHLTELKNLKTLNLQETKVTPAGVAELKGKLRGVTIAR
jgi:hypothetical protein